MLYKYSVATFKEYISKLTSFHERIADELKGENDFYTVYVNPTELELGKLGTRIRGIVDIKNNNVYMWDASEAGHARVARHMNISSFYSFWGAKRTNDQHIHLFSFLINYQDKLKNIPYFDKHKNIMSWT